MYGEFGVNSVGGGMSVGFVFFKGGNSGPNKGG